MIKHDHPIVQKLNETDLDLHLVGSRFMGSHNAASDYDFYCASEYWPTDKASPTKREYVEATLERLGFKKVGNGTGYEDDNELSGLWRWTDPDTRLNWSSSKGLPPVDVLCFNPKVKEHRMACLNRIKSEGGGWGHSAGKDLVGALKGKGQAWALLFRLMKA